MNIMKTIDRPIILAAIAGAITFLVITLILYKSNVFAKMAGRKKWRELQPQLQVIRDIHNRATGTGKRINWIEKNLTRSVQKSFDNSKLAYIEYINFCNSKHLELPANKAELDELIATTEEELLSPNAALDKELQRSSQQYDAAYALVSGAGENLLAQRHEAVRMIDNVEQLINSIAQRPKSFETDIQEIVIHKQKFKDTIEFGTEQRKALETSAKSAGAGVAAGATFASMAPTAAMWVATTFGTASTGTAISALSGAAATNAALAWLGGGALAAGGGGMAAGHALLALAGPIGWGIAGTSLALSVFLTIRKRLKIQESKKDEIARMKNCVEALKEVKGKIDKISVETSGLYDGIARSLEFCNSMRGRDYMSFSNNQKEALGTLVNNTKALSVLLNETVSE